MDYLELPLPVVNKPRPGNGERGFCMEMVNAKPSRVQKMAAVISASQRQTHQAARSRPSEILEAATSEALALESPSRMSTPEERKHACEAFLEPQGLGYARQVIDDGETRWMLFDEDGDPLVISSLNMIRSVAMEAGLVLCSVH